jgi:RNase H
MSILPRSRKNIVIFCDSQSAIQSLANPVNYHPSALSFKQALVKICDNNFNLSLQWIPGHAGTRGNEKADRLAKKALCKTPPPPTGVDLASLRITVKRRMKENVTNQWETKTKDKQWREEVKKGPDKTWTRRVATAQFRLATGHDVLQHHLNRFKITEEPALCKLCKNGVQDRAHLFSCAALKMELDTLPNNLSRTEKESTLYWVARKKNG